LPQNGQTSSDEQPAILRLGMANRQVSIQSRSTDLFGTNPIASDLAPDALDVLPIVRVLSLKKTDKILLRFCVPWTVVGPACRIYKR
jgi:hypothetical protein